MSIPTDTATGTEVMVVYLDGTGYAAVTSLPPHQVRGKRWVVFLEGIPRAVELKCVELRTTNQGDTTP